MRGASKTLVAVVALLLAVGLAACGGGDDSGSTATDTAAQGQTAGGQASGETTEAPSQQSAGKGNGGSGGAQSEGSGPAGGNEEESSGSSAPQQGQSSGSSVQPGTKGGGEKGVQDFGQEASASEREAAEAALTAFLDARAKGDGDTACSYIAKNVAEAFEKLAKQTKQVDDTSCAGIIEAVTDPAARKAVQEEAERAEVASLRISGDRAFAIYSGAGGKRYAMSMTKEGDDWKVASIVGTPLE